MTADRWLPEQEWRVLAARFYKSEKWLRLKSQVWERSAGRCERISDGRRCVRQMDTAHHLTDWNYFNPLLTDLQAVCDPCHVFLSRFSKKSFAPSMKDPILVQRNVLTFGLARLNANTTRQRRLEKRDRLRTLKAERIQEWMQEITSVRSAPEILPMLGQRPRASWWISGLMDEIRLRDARLEEYRNVRSVVEQEYDTLYQEK